MSEIESRHRRWAAELGMEALRRRQQDEIQFAIRELNHAPDGEYIATMLRLHEVERTRFNEQQEASAMSEQSKPTDEREIRPALSAEEWAEAAVEGTLHRGGITVETEPDGLRIIQGGDYVDVQHGSDLYANETHALAALCLHGQPFGFGWEDVARCRAAAGRAEAEHDNPDGEMYMELAAYEEMQAWESLADRIASLLPPREP